MLWKKDIRLKNEQYANIYSFIFGTSLRSVCLWIARWRSSILIGWCAGRSEKIHFAIRECWVRHAWICIITARIHAVVLYQIERCRRKRHLSWNCLQRPGWRIQLVQLTSASAIRLNTKCQHCHQYKKQQRAKNYGENCSSGHIRCNDSCTFWKAGWRAAFVAGAAIRVRPAEQIVLTAYCYFKPKRE